MTKNRFHGRIDRRQFVAGAAASVAMAELVITA